MAVIMNYADVFNIGAVAALATALCWGIGPVISVGPSTKLGSIGFVRWRMYTALLVLIPIIMVQGNWDNISLFDGYMLILSGVIGIFLGDTLLFATVNILGPRRASVLFASNAAIAAVLAVAFLGEQVTLLLGIAFALVTSGVMIAIFFGKRKGNTHIWEMNQGRISLGIILGIGAAICQALGSILAKPVMDGGIDPMLTSTMRIAAAAIAHTILLFLMPKYAANKQPLDWLTFWQVTATSFLGMVLGMTLLMFAFANGNVSWVSVLSSISPILTLPILWFFYKKIPPIGAWLGAILTIIGTAIIILNI